jgi:hypothetical protein
MYAYAAKKIIASGGDGQFGPIELPDGTWVYHRADDMVLDVTVDEEYPFGEELNCEFRVVLNSEDFPEGSDTDAVNGKTMRITATLDDGFDSVLNLKKQAGDSWNTAVDFEIGNYEGGRNGVKDTIILDVGEQHIGTGVKITANVIEVRSDDFPSNWNFPPPPFPPGFGDHNSFYSDLTGDDTTTVVSGLSVGVSVASESIISFATVFEATILRGDADNDSLNGETLRVTATMGGAVVQLKESVEDSFANHIDFIVENYSGDKNGVLDSFYMDVEDEDDGNEVVITCTVVGQDPEVTGSDSTVLKEFVLPQSARLAGYEDGDLEVISYATDSSDTPWNGSFGQLGEFIPPVAGETYHYTYEVSNRSIDGKMFNSAWLRYNPTSNEWNLNIYSYHISGDPSIPDFMVTVWNGNRSGRNPAGTYFYASSYNDENADVQTLTVEAVPD